VRITRSPLRAARKSVGALGNSSDGGCGGPIVAHAVNVTVNVSALRAGKSVSRQRLMQKKQTTRARVGAGDSPARV